MTEPGAGDSGQDNGQDDTNTSGMGMAAVVPSELRGWNWGAFLLNWIWGLGNNTFIALLMFVPLVNLVMPFVLGAKGNEWAWRNTRWRSVAHFRSVQRIWTLVGVVVYVAIIGLALGLAMLFITLLKSSDAYQLSGELLRDNPVVERVFGKPIETGIPSGAINITGSHGKADLSYSVQGPQASGTAYVEASKIRGKWTIEHLELKINGATQRLVLIPAPPIE